MIVPQQMAGKRIAVFGLARTGVAVVRALTAAGAVITVWDDDADRRAPLSDLAGDLYRLDLSGFDALVGAPGVPLNHPAPHPVVARAQNASVPVIGDMDLFQGARGQLPAHKLVGVTGTNGKSTTVALITHLLNQAGLPAVAAGNIGLPVLSLTPLPSGGIYVFELSSFQLELTRAIDADIAILLNLSPDHLDRHGSMGAYLAAKKRLFDLQSPGRSAIVGLDTAETAALADTLPGPVITIATRTTADIHVTATGSLVERGETIAGLRDCAALKGRHNWQNAAAAYAAARALGVDREVLLNGLRRFPGLAHRQEPVATVRGVQYINDSKATNWEAAATGLSAFDRVHWLAGGRLKDEDTTPIVPLLPRVLRLYAFGEAADTVVDLFGAAVPQLRCRTLTEAVDAAAARAMPGDVVLLSPGCASFDQFRDFEARGDTFKAAVTTVAQAQEAAQ